MDPARLGLFKGGFGDWLRMERVEVLGKQPCSVQGDVNPAPLSIPW